MQRIDSRVNDIIGQASKSRKQVNGGKQVDRPPQHGINSEERDRSEAEKTRARLGLSNFERTVNPVAGSNRTVLRDSLRMIE